MKTPGRTVSINRRNPSTPVRCWVGVPAQRRHNARPKVLACCGRGASVRVASVLRSTSSTLAKSSSAVMRGLSTP